MWRSITSSDVVRLLKVMMKMMMLLLLLLLRVLPLFARRECWKENEELSFLFTSRNDKLEMDEVKVPLLYKLRKI